MMFSTRPVRACAALLLSLAAAGAASAQEVSWSAFGTIGAAVSDRDWTYQRYIDDGGTLERDSVFGVQMDTKFSPAWSATVQGKLAPSLRKDDAWDLSASWAFLSWRPSNEWLVRGGKLRVPLYLFSENLDVGQSYDLARMPTETYSIAPTTDITGLYVTRSWAFTDAELSLDAVYGRAKVFHRFYTRDTGADIRNVHTKVGGAVLSWRQDDLTLRASWLRANTDLGGSIAYPTRLTHVELPGASFYVPAGTTEMIRNDVLSLGMDWRMGQGWRVIAEFERDIQQKTTIGANTYGGHVAVLKTMGRWTPYTVVSGIRSTSAQRKLRSGLEAAQVPFYVPRADELSGAQRAFADTMPFYDQHTLALGASYALNPHSKIKAELAHTWVGQGSVMIDSPPGAPNISHKGINVLSLSYNFAF